MDIKNVKTKPSHNRKTKKELETEIESLNTQLIQQKKELDEARTNAENALRIKSEFLANVSHEIRTPLNAVLGFSQWLYENTQDMQHREYLSTILHSARNLLNLLNDILDLSKIESGKINIDLHPMNYQEVINDIKLVFQQKVEEKGLTMKITTDSTVPDFIFMDEIRFYQIVFNLVSNAIKFTRSGYIHVSANAEKTKKHDEINFVVTIEDTGIGIQEYQKKSIFENFSQQTREKYNDEKGTGLGLAIVNGLLKKLNGTIRMKSKPGKGTVFTVTFYKVKVDFDENTRVETFKEGANMKLAPCKIMIVDDISYNILVLKQLINSEHVTYIEATDGTNALAKLKTEKPDLIFMDIRMPGISGFDATELIKQDKELKNIPVIAFTGSTIKDHNSRINNLFDGFLQKPVFKKDLESVLKRFLKYTFEQESDFHEADHKNLPEISDNCLESLPNVLKESYHTFYPKWNKLNGSLVIFEIESFTNTLKEMAEINSCNLVFEYCQELEKGIKSFDIELIKRKLEEFPPLIKKLEGYYEKMIH